MKRSLLLLVIAAAVTVSAHAQDICRNEPDLKKCVERFGDQWVEARVATTNSGVSTQSASKDFLSTLAAALLMPMDGNGVGPLALDFNVPIGKAAKHRLQLEAVLARPDLGSDVKQRLSANAAAMTATKDSLTELDDVMVSAAIEPSTLRFGRSFAPHRERYATLLTALNETEPLTDDAIRNFAERFAMLLHNQPQFYGSLNYRARTSVAGPNERSARVTYEMGFRNLNRFACRGNTKECAEKLMAEPPIDKDPADRVAFSAEYRESDGRTVDLRDHNVHFHATGARSFVYSLAYGRKNMLNENGRIDLAVNYEDTTVSETTDLIPIDAALEPPQAVRDRFVASATYTYQLSNNMAIPLSLVYANHAAYLGEVDRKLNMHVGVTFKMR